MPSRFTQSISSALLAATLAACGGGGGDSGGGGGGAAGSFTLTGTVAKQQGLGGASVTAKCAGGSTGSATSAADGSYSMTIAGQLPCVLKATAGSDVFHSVQYGTAPGGTFRTNVSLLTEMMVAKFAAQSPDAYYAGFACAGGTECISRSAVEATLPYLSTALSIDLNLTNINILTAVYGANSPVELKTGELVTRMNAKPVTAKQLTDAIVANPTNPGAVAALFN